MNEYLAAASALGASFVAGNRWDVRASRVALSHCGNWVSRPLNLACMAGLSFTHRLFKCSKRALLLRIRY